MSINWNPLKVLVKGQSQEIKNLRAEEFAALRLAQRADKEVDICTLIDAIIPPAEREKGPSIGEYFLYVLFLNFGDF